MEPSRLCFIGLQLLTLTYTAQSLVMLTANSEDFKKLARKFVSESLADKVAEFLAISSGKIVETLSTENDLNDVVHKDISMDVSDTIDRKDEFELRNRDIHQEGKPIRETKDLNTQPLKEIKLDIALQKEPKHSQEEIEDRQTPTKIKAKRPSLIKKYYKQKILPYRPGKIDHLNQELSKVDKYEQFGDPEKPIYHPHKLMVDPKEDIVKNDNRHLQHPHIRDLERIEEDRDNIEKQSTKQRKNIKQLHRKPSQPNRDLLKLTNQFPKYKQDSKNPNYNFEQAHISSLTPDSSGNFKKDPINDFQQDEIENFNQDSNGNVNHDHISEFQRDPIYNFKQDSIGDDHIDVVKKDKIDNFKQDLIGKFDQGPIDEKDFKQYHTEKLNRQTTVKLLRIREELFEHKKTNSPLSKQPKVLLTELKGILHTGRNKAQYKNQLKIGHHYPHHKLYFPNKPRMPTAAEKQHNYEDAEILEQFKKIKKLIPQSDVKESLKIVDRYPIHKRTHHLESKLGKDKYFKGETQLSENNDNTESSIIAHFLTTKIPKTA